VTSLESLLRRIARVLDDRNIPYAVMGGLAVRVYAIPRFTNDIDLTISLDREQLPQLVEAFESIDCGVSPPFRAGWLDSVAGLPLFKAEYFGDERSIEIDIFVAETDFQRSLIDRRQLVQTPDGPFWFVSPEDLILLKLLASRPRDLIDVQDILFTLGELDVGYLRRWADALSLTESLDRIMREFNPGNGSTP
jgi:hypothetical protein